MGHELEPQPAAAERSAQPAVEGAASRSRGDRSVSNMARSRQAAGLSGSNILDFYANQRATNDPDNLLEEVDAAEVCEGLAEDARALLERFVHQVRALLQPWAAQRQTPNLRFEAAPLDALFHDLELDWMDLSSNRGGALGSPESIHRSPLARGELVRQLNSGATPQFIQEIRCFNYDSLIKYVDLLGLEDRCIQHRYTLTTQVALSVGGEVAFGLNGSMGVYKVKYENEIGMSWCMNFACEKIGFSVGFGGEPISVNVETSFGSDAVNSGGAAGVEYVGPDFFSHALVRFGGADAVIGSPGVTGAFADGYGLGFLTLTNGLQTLTFDTTGVVMRFGTDYVGSAGVTLGVGRTLPLGDEPEGFEMPPVEDKAMAPVAAQWAPLIQAAIFFPTGSAALDERDLRDLARVSEAIRARGESNPEASFQIQLIGRSSRRWSASAEEGEAAQNNQALTDARTAAVRDELNGRLSGLNCQLLASSQMAEATARSSSQDPQSDDAIERSVYIGVFYDACQGFNASIAPQPVR